MYKYNYETIIQYKTKKSKIKVTVTAVKECILLFEVLFPSSSIQMYNLGRFGFTHTERKSSIIPSQ